MLATRHATRNQLSDLPSRCLTHESSSLSLSCTILSKAKAFDVRMCEGAVVAGVALDFADLNHFEIKPRV
jgi:hypothetical protein